MRKINTIILTNFLLIMTSAPALAGDAVAGMSAFNSKGCIGCHGAGGGSPVTTTPATPKLSGQDAKYIEEQLTDFKSGARKNATMNAMAAMLTDADVKNVAAYLSTQK